MTIHQRIKNKVRARSIHVAYVDVGSCNGCDIEVLACLAPRYDIEQYGIFVHNNPREADVLLVIGAYTPGWEEKLAMVWDKIPDPKASRGRSSTTAELPPLGARAVDRWAVMAERRRD